MCVKGLFMNDVLKFGKKLFTFSVVAVTIVWSMGLAALVPTAVQAAEECPALEAGDVFKLTNSSAVYLVDENLNRDYFPHARVFNTWFKDYSSVQTISMACGEQYERDSAVKFRAGAKLLKDPNWAAVYAVYPDGSVAHIKSADVAKDLYGANWGSLLVDVDQTMLALYSSSADLETSVPHDGMLVKTADDSMVYYVSGGMLHEVTGSLVVAGGDVRTVSATVLDSVEMSGTTVTEAELLDDILMDTGTNDAEDPTEEDGELTVSLSANTPAAGNVIYNVNVDVAKFVFTAGGDVDVKVNSVKIGRKGLGATGDFASVTLYDGSTKLGTTKTSWSSDGTMNYNISGGWTIPKNTPKTLTMVANFDTAGTHNALGVESVSLASGSVSGLPLYGNEVSAVAVTVGRVTVTNQGTAATKKIGNTDVTLAQFRLAVDSVEDAKLRSITLKNKAATNNASDGDVANVYLYQGTTKLAGPVSMKTDKVTFDISEDAWVLIKKNKNDDFKVIGDIVDGNANTVEFVLDATTDIKMYGETYHSQLLVTSTAYDAATEGAIITIAGSELNLAYTGNPLDTTDDKTDVEFGMLTLSAGNTDTKITSLILTVDETNGDGNETNNLDVDEFELIAEDGTAYTGTMTDGGDTNAYDETWTFSDEIYLNAGETLKLTMRGDLPTGIGDEDSYKVTLTVNTTNVVAETVPAGDSVSSFSIGSFNGKLVTVKTPYLTIKSIDLNTGLKAVVNQEDVVIFKGTLEAVSDTITLSRLKFEGGHATAGNVTLTTTSLDSTNWSSLGLYKVTKDSVGDDVYELWQNVNNSDLTTGYVDFNSFSVDIVAGSANKVTFAVKGTVSASLSANTTVHAQLDTVTVKDSDGDAVSAKNSAGTAIATTAELETTTTYTLGGTGVLYVAMRNGDTGFNKDRVVLAGDGVWVGKLRLRAEYEAIKLMDLKLTNNSADDEDSVESVCLYKAQAATAENKIGCTTLDTNDLAFFDDLNYNVVEGTQDIYIYVQTRAMGNAGLATADSKDVIGFEITTTSGHLTARGVDSNTDLAYGDFDSSAAAGEIVFDNDLDGTFDEAADTETASTKNFYVAGSRISNVQLVNSFGGQTVASTISGTGEITLAILAITTEANSNTDASGNALKTAISEFRLDVSKFASTTLNAAPTIQRIGGVTAASALTTTASSTTGVESADTSGDWTMTTVTTTLGNDALIDAGETAYYVIKGNITGLSAVSNETNWVQISLDDLKGTAGSTDANNNLDWFDGYDTTYTVANDFDYLLLDTESISGTKISAPTNN